jgi:DNA repair exonuclease SbcCD ATPase subunit
MIKLLSLSFENIGRFVEKQTIDFTNKSRLLQFDGKNENTGGSSGSGKSTVFIILDFILGVSDTPISSLQSRLTKSGYFAEGVFEINGEIVTISRSKKDGLIVKTPTETIEGNSKIAEEKIDQLIGIPRKLFKKMIHKRQKEGGFFLELTAKESYQFMVESLGLQEWESKSEKINETIKDKELKIIKLENEISISTESLERYRSDLSSLSKPEPVDEENLKLVIINSQKAVDVANQNIDEFRKTLTEIKAETDKKVTESVPPQPIFEQSEEVLKLQEELKSTKHREIEELSKLNTEEVDKKIAQCRSLILETNTKQSQVETLASQTKELVAQKKHIETAQCPTCSQEWKGESAQSKIKELEQKISANIEKMTECKKYIDNLPAVEAAITKLEQSKNQILEKRTQVSLEFSALKSEISNKINNIESEKNQKMLEWNAKKQEIINQIKEDARKKEETINNLIGTAMEGKSLAEKSLVQAANILNNYKSQLINYEKLASGTEARIQGLEKNISEKQQGLKTFKKDLLIYSEAQRAIKTYTLQIFQDTLNFIGQYATQILNAVPAMASATLYFENCKETKTGKIKDEINCIINVDGENDVNIKTLSGGERTAVDLAVDLAVIEVLESQVGKGADWIILDEPFTGLDSIGCEAAIDIIKQVGIKKRIIIVDHNESVKQVIDETITVHRKGLESVIIGG